MIDVRRYKGLLVAGVGLYCALMVCNAGLWAGLGDRPKLFENPDRRLAWSQLEDSGARVSGVEREMRRGGLGDQPVFGVVLGQSTALRGIDPGVLEAVGEPPMRWLLVNGFGGSFTKLLTYSRVLLASGLRPSVVVIGVHSTMLAGQAETSAAQRERGVLRRAKQCAKLRWVRQQRRDVSHYAELSLFEFRLALHGAMGSGAVGVFEPADGPWRIEERAQEEFDRDAQAAHWRRFGWFEAETYQHAESQEDAFRALIGGLDGLGVRHVVIVRMPVTSELRNWLPDAADARLRALIDEVSAGRSVRVIDMRGVMPDEAFADYAHLTPGGRGVFTRALGERLEGVLGGGEEEGEGEAGR